MVVRSREMLCQQSVMQALNIPPEAIPTFENPHPAINDRKPGTLGYACHGKKIESCKAWLGKFVSEMNDEKLEVHLCRICREKG